ncbi:hypothetical protein [Saccharicrinis sp. FJH54]|uniref:hypothetical protein n=1 Tax=Saccharicrinis sp. FJH54 TaxID=3344665 RepID=UPI0035D4E46B
MNEHKISELKRIFNDRAFYSPEQRYEAVSELELFEPLNGIMDEFKQNYENNLSEAELSKRNNIFYNDPDITFSDEAPLLYRKAVIHLFSTLFTVFAGSILMAINLKVLKRETESFWCASFGFFIFMGIPFFIMIFDLNTLWFISLNGILGTAFNEMYWKRYIGIVLKYRKRSALIPALIWIVISVAAVVIMISANN